MIGAEFSFAPSELAMRQAYPTACAVGYILAPLRGWAANKDNLAIRYAEQQVSRLAVAFAPSHSK
jgi:hypothetical protein